MQAVLTHTYIHIHTHTFTYIHMYKINKDDFSKNSPLYLYKRKRQRDGKVKQNKYTMLVQKQNEKKMSSGGRRYRQLSLIHI